MNIFKMFLMNGFEMKIIQNRLIDVDNICDGVLYTIGEAVTCAAHVDGISW